MFCRISFIPNRFNRNRNRNRFVPITFEFVTICDICDQNVTKSVLLNKLKKTRACDQGHKFKIVTFCDRHKCHTLRGVPSEIQTYKIHEGLCQGFKRVWHFVTFCDISKCHKVTLLNFLTNLGLCHTVRIFFSFFFSDVPRTSMFRSFISLGQTQIS